MQINIVSDNFSKSTISMQLVDFIESEQASLDLEDSIVYYEFPLFKEVNQSILYPSFTIVSPNYGIILIQCDDRTNRTITKNDAITLFEYTDQLSNFIFSKLIKVPSLRKKRSKNELIFNIHTILYLPNYDLKISNEDYDYIEVVNSYTSLKNFFDNNKNNPLTSEEINDICSVIDGSRGLPKPKDRNITEESRGSKGALIEDLEKEIAVFDERQKIAALTQIDGPQRIRGLAGSGKTVVLAMKAALLHLKKPEAKILYTFYTKSLYDHIRNLITRFYRMHEDHDPNWDKIHVRHAWGGVNLPGVYYEACKANRIVPVTYNEAALKSRHPFNYVCEDLLDKTNGNPRTMYDYILLDEGQDFDPPFYWLLRKIVKNDCLVWAYDELQNIMNIDIQETKEIFKNKYGDEGIDLAKLKEDYPRQYNDIILYKCYRNPKEILVMAHAIGFGIYSDYIVQTLENKEHWQDLGYDTGLYNCVKGENTIITRPDKNSPSSISSEQTIDEIIDVYVANGMDDEIDWVCNNIKEDLNQKLLPEDILVISLDNRFARKYFEGIEKRLNNEGINTNNILTSYFGDVFIVEGCITLSTVYRAKGNEAASVYVVGADSFNDYRKYDIFERNKLFTAFTRAKAWLKISGANDSMNFLADEICKAKKYIPRLVFEKYPDKEAIKTLRRELAETNAEKNRKLRELQEKLDELGLDSEDAINLLKSRRYEK